MIPAGEEATVLRQTAPKLHFVSPFMPHKAEELWTQLGAPGRADDQRLASVLSVDGAGWRVTKGAPMFPRPETPKAS